MIEHLADRLEHFPGASNQTRCFLHILSITAKAIIKQFNVLKTKNDSAVDEVAQALARLAEGIDIEEQDAWGTEECFFFFFFDFIYIPGHVSKTKTGRPKPLKQGGGTNVGVGGVAKLSRQYARGPGPL
jgi:hypothetical protein